MRSSAEGQAFIWSSNGQNTYLSGGGVQSLRKGNETTTNPNLWDFSSTSRRDLGYERMRFSGTELLHVLYEGSLFALFVLYLFSKSICCGGWYFHSKALLLREGHNLYSRMLHDNMVYISSFWVQGKFSAPGRVCKRPEPPHSPTSARLQFICPHFLLSGLSADLPGPGSLSRLMDRWKMKRDAMNTDTQYQVNYIR